METLYEPLYLHISRMFVQICAPTKGAPLARECRAVSFIGLCVLSWFMAPHYFPST